jgi:tellurite resistance protein TehA-like permease
MARPGVSGRPRPPGPAGPAGLAGLFPGYFAMVMATGIIATAAKQQDITWLATALYIVAAVAYVVLIGLYVARLVLYRDRFVADLTSHQKGFTFLTAVAGSEVLGGASIILYSWWTVGWVLWFVGLALWAVLLYTSLIAIVVRSARPGLAAGISGTWLLLTVSTESIAVLGALLLPRSTNELQAVVCVSAFTLGIVLYLMVMTLLFMRWVFRPLDPTEAGPPSWIAAGAVAITVLAGSNLLLASDSVPLLADLGPFLRGMVLLAWATSTFWFPLLVAIGVWRHLVRKVPLRYEPAYWSLVFPIGMYGASTFRMRAALPLTSLEALPKVVLAAALVAWAATFVGLVAHLAAAAGRRRQRHV